MQRLDLIPVQKWCFARCKGRVSTFKSVQRLGFDRCKGTDSDPTGILSPGAKVGFPVQRYPFSGAKVAFQPSSQRKGWVLTGAKVVFRPVQRYRFRLYYSFARCKGRVSTFKSVQRLGFDRCKGILSPRCKGWVLTFKSVQKLGFDRCKGSVSTGAKVRIQTVRVFFRPGAKVGFDRCKGRFSTGAKVG